jgi:tetratricopeptide (TPR) repeat protein
VARVATADRGGLEDLKQSIAVAERANSPESIRGYFNLAAMLANLGDLRGAGDFLAQGRRLAERFGDTAWSEYFDAERVYQHYWLGEWDAALSLAEQLIARAERGVLRRPELDASLVRSWIALARGDTAQAVADADRAHSFSRAVGVPQNLYPTLAIRARALLAMGREEEAAASAQELLQLMRAQPSLPSFWVMDVAIVLAELGRGDELAEASASAPETLWAEAAKAYVCSDPAGAAEVLVVIGALPEEAYARLKAGEGALADERRVDAEAQLERALDFYRRVEATAYCRSAEALLELRQPAPAQ